MIKKRGHPHQWYGGYTYAQHGDDLAVLNIFKRLGVERPSYLDVGAHHPYDLSNTALLYERGSRGICVEPNPDLAPLFLSLRPEDRLVQAAVVADFDVSSVRLHRHQKLSGINSTLRMPRSLSVRDSVIVPAVRIDEIVETTTTTPDFLSIDAEGRDLSVLQTMIMRPSVICAEAISHFGDVSEQIRSWARGAGYYVHSWAGSNMLMVLQQFAELLH